MPVSISSIILATACFRLHPFDPETEVPPVLDLQKRWWAALVMRTKTYNMPAGSDYKFESLDGKTYVEVGTGVDNIFRLFRVDFIWRLAPTPAQGNGEEIRGILQLPPGVLTCSIQWNRT